MRKNSSITVFEHQPLRTDKGNPKITETQYKALKKHFDEKEVPYYSLINNGVKFNKYVGVIQVGQTLIEVLPKADKYTHESEWRKILIGMVRAVRFFNVTPTSESSLKLKPNSLLELYFEMFIGEAERILRKGLVKTYRKTEGNNYTLKGSIHFSKHLNQNLTHQERFFVRHTVYDSQHILNKVLFKTLILIKSINKSPSLNSRISCLLLDFPEMLDINVNTAFFKSIVFNRKTDDYRKAIEIARLLLLSYHPDVSQGHNHVLALMFDMNLLWEQFVYASLKVNRSEDTTIHGQNSKDFWETVQGNRKSRMRPDIVINKDEKGKSIVLDTKWKNLNGKNPSPDDLRQMYVYHKYYGAKKVALIYPGDDNDPVIGQYFAESDDIPEINECSLISVSTNATIKDWQESIWKNVAEWARIN